MNELTSAQKEQQKSEVMQLDHVMNAHKFLLDFLSRFDHAKRGGIHDFMEIALFNMVSAAIKGIDDYLQSGHKSIVANELMSIFADSCQNILDNIKRNLESMKQVNLQ